MIDKTVLQTKIIERRTIPDAWLAACFYCVARGKNYVTDRGSFEGRIRRQLEHLTVIITHPETRPFACSYGGKSFSDDVSIQTYFERYIISPTIPGDEQYTYGQRIYPHIDRIGEMLRHTPHTNQAFIPVALPTDWQLKDPPCLQNICFKVVGNKINLCALFRSWDVESGFPSNAGALQLLNELIAELAGRPTGKLILFSDGAHSYQDWSSFT